MGMLAFWSGLFVVIYSIISLSAKKPLVTFLNVRRPFIGVSSILASNLVRGRQVSNSDWDRTWDRINIVCGVH